MTVPVCLDFHHVRDKIIEISRAAHCAWSLGKIKDEMRKCVILCCNCHRIETHQLCSSS